MANCPASVKSAITQVGDHVKMTMISKLINGIQEFFKKLLKYFHATAISTSFVLPSAGVFPAIFILDLSDPEFVKSLFGLSL